MPATDYGALTPRQAAYAVEDLLTRIAPYQLIERVSKAFPLPKNETKVAVFRRYNALTNTPTVLTDGVTPADIALTFTNITATLSQYGGIVTLTDQVMDTGEDSVMEEAKSIIAQQAGEQLENMRFGIARAGTNVVFANGAARATVNTALTLDLIRRAVRSLQRNTGKPLSRVIRSTSAWGTENIQPAYFALIHPDTVPTLRGLPGFASTADYGQISPWEAEVGSVENVRFLQSALYAPFANAGNATLNGMLGGTAVDVYPTLIFAQEAFGTVALKGENAMRLTMTKPGAVSDSDPLGQRTKIGWKALQTAVILNDGWMVRVEHGNPV